MKFPLLDMIIVIKIKINFAYVECINYHHVYASPRVINMYKYYIDKVDHNYIKNSSFRRLIYSKVLIF